MRYHLSLDRNTGKEKKLLDAHLPLLSQKKQINPSQKLPLSERQAILICTVLAALPSIFLMLAVPPLLNNTDSFDFFLRNLPHLVPHFPPLYPLFVRSIAAFTGFSQTSIDLVITAQHVLSVAGMAAIVAWLPGTWRKIFCTFFLLAANYFNVIAHGIFSEALALALLLFYFAAACAVMTAENQMGMGKSVKIAIDAPRVIRLSIKLSYASILICAVYGLLYAMCLARHPMVAYATILPLFYLLKSIGTPGKGRKYLMRFAGHMGLALLAVGAAHCTNVFAYKLLGSKTDFILGRASAYRFSALPWKRMESGEKAELIESIKSHTDDPYAREAVQLMIDDEQPWIGAFKKLEKIVTDKHLNESADEIMNKAAIAFYKTPNKYLVQDILRDSDYYWSNRDHCFSKIIESAKLSLQWFHNYPDPPEVAALPFVKNADVRQYDRINYICKRRLFDEICNYYLLAAAALVIAVLRTILKRTSPALIPIVIAIGLSGPIYSLLMAVVTVTLPRYNAPLNATIWTMLALACLLKTKSPQSGS